MSGITRFVHIGFPKSASTSLQNFYFGVHEEIYHLGLGYESKGNRYVDEGVEQVSEVDVRLKKEFVWSLEESRARLAPALEAAETGGYKATGMSNEFHSFALGNEVDTADKMRRLHALFGEGTKLIVVIREQFSFLKSLYLELLKGGYGGTYRNFLEYTYLYQVRSWCSDICYHNIYELGCEIYGEGNVHFAVLEDLKKDAPAFLSDMSAFLGVSNSVTEMRAVNTQEDSLEWYEQLRRYNERFPREFGTKFFEPFNMNRMRSYFHNELGLAVPHDRLADDMLRVPMSQAAKQATQFSKVTELDLTFPNSLRQKFNEVFAPSNARLSKHLGRDLGEVGYVMPDAQEA